MLNLKGNKVNGKDPLINTQVSSKMITLSIFFPKFRGKYIDNKTRLGTGRHAVDVIFYKEVLCVTARGVPRTAYPVCGLCYWDRGCTPCPGPGRGGGARPGPGGGTPGLGGTHVLVLAGRGLPTVPVLAPGVVPNPRT